MFRNIFFFSLSLFLIGPVFGRDLLKEIYPWKPIETNDFKSRVSYLTEEASPIINVIEMDGRGLTESNSVNRPWGGSFWPLIQGQIANTWQEKSYSEPWKLLGWKGNVKRWEKRRDKELPNVLSMTEKELAELAPSEKYDLILGDKSFDLTNRIWNFAEKWGETKKWGFLSSIDIPEGYRIPKANKLMALWEGICHGWALAAGTYPRPEKSVFVFLPNGKRVLFYPDDIKALVSLMYSNSTLQSHVLVEGYRCNEKNPPRDEFGRNVDSMPQKLGEEILPRCADVHPAVWHSSVVNLIGVQGRALVTEIDMNATVNNHPMAGYKFRWFNPNTGKTGKIADSLLELKDYVDPYQSARNPEATKLIGVEMDMVYVDWVTPKDNLTNSIEDDKLKTQTFLYDLELDKNGNIVGGQWRAERVIKKYDQDEDGVAPSIKQPDFFWVAPKDYKNYFKPLTLEPWNTKLPVPSSWGTPARSAHAFTYHMTHDFGFDEKCTVLAIKGKGSKEVPCEFKYPAPQPLINVVEELVKMSQE
ncbi:MAG: hypothetical protein K2P81_11560 [Bacteriovoracaceae bacterium]|nr:hypothetical protein [Bacteriovoracaceae bacterium]